MSKIKNANKETFEHPANQQQKLANSIAAGALPDPSADKPHNTKKEALGPNTKRK